MDILTLSSQQVMKLCSYPLPSRRAGIPGWMSMRRGGERGRLGRRGAGPLSESAGSCYLRFVDRRRLTVVTQRWPAAPAARERCVGRQALRAG